MLRRGLPRIGRAEPQNKEDEVVVPDPFKKGTIIAARENLPAVAFRSRLVKQGGEITSGVHYVAARRDIRRPMPQSCSPPAMSSSSTWVTSRTTR